MRSRYASACSTRTIGGRRFGMMIARANWRALCGTTTRSAAPSRTCRCQSSGRTIVTRSGMRGLSHPPRGDAGSAALRPEAAHDCGRACLHSQLFVDALQVLLDGAMAAAEDGADVAVGLAGGQPAVHLALLGGEHVRHRTCLARRGDLVRAQAAIKTRQDRPDAIEQLAFAVGEIAALAIEDKADEHALVDEDRQGNDVIDADAAVVLVVERAVAKAAERHRVADPVRAASALDG